MPRKTVITKEYILKKTKEYIIKYGANKLQARSLATYMGCSTQPIFKNFKNMQDLQDTVKKNLIADYIKFKNNYVNEKNYLVGETFAYVLFAKRNPNVFKIIFGNDVSKILGNDEIFSVIEKQYSINREKAEKSYKNVMMCIYGLSILLADQSIKLSDNEIYHLINEAIKMNIK